MSDDLSVTITGTSAVIGGLNTWITHVQAAVQALLEQAGQGTLDDAQAAAPVLTGDLRDSGHMDVEPMNVSVTFGNDQVDYAAPVEFGHITRSGSHVPAQPFLYPSFESHAQQLSDDVRNL